MIHDSTGSRAGEIKANIGTLRGPQSTASVLSRDQPCSCAWLGNGSCCAPQTAQSISENSLPPEESHRRAKSVGRWIPDSLNDQWKTRCRELIGQVYHYGGIANYVGVPVMCDRDGLEVKNAPWIRQKDRAFYELVPVRHFCRLSHPHPHAHPSPPEVDVTPKWRAIGIALFSSLGPEGSSQLPDCLPLRLWHPELRGLKRINDVTSGGTTAPQAVARPKSVSLLRRQTSHVSRWLQRQARI